MYNQTYEDYIRSVLGYSQDDRMQHQMQEYNHMQYHEPTQIHLVLDNINLEDSYPEIYKLVYPMVDKICKNNTKAVTDDLIEKMTDEVFLAVEANHSTQININLANETRGSYTRTYNGNRSKNRNVQVNKSNEIKEHRHKPNRTLRDLIKVLVIRDLLRPRNPHSKHSNYNGYYNYHSHYNNHDLFKPYHLNRGYNHFDNQRVIPPLTYIENG